MYKHIITEFDTVDEIKEIPNGASVICKGIISYLYITVFIKGPDGLILHRPDREPSVYSWKYLEKYWGALHIYLDDDY